jgi:hypothetical protein
MGTTYDVEVVSLAYGCESAVYTSSFTTLIVCTTPTNIGLSATSNTVTLSWDAMAGSLSYKVVYFVPGLGWQSATTEDTFLTLSHAGEGGYAYFYVRSVCGDDYVSSYSSVQSIELPDCDIDLSINSSSTSFCSGESLSLSVSSAYEAYQWYLDGSPLSGATSSSYTALSGGSYSVFITDSYGCEFFTNDFAVTELSSSASTLDIDDIGSTSASLEWESISDSEIFDVSYSSDGGQTWTTIQGVEDDSYTLTSLQPFTTYQVEVVSLDYTCETYAASFTTLADCIYPSNIGLSAYASTVTMTWDAVVGASSY